MSIALWVMVIFSWLDLLRETNVNQIENKYSFIYSHIGNDDERRGA